MRTTGFKGSMLGGAAAAALALFASPAAVAAQTATYNFNIPAQDLGAALRAYGRASRQQVVFDSQDTRGKRSTALVGTFSADAGLRQLLTGTGLTARRGSSGVLIVADPQRAGAAAASTQDSGEEAVANLEEVVVTGTHIRGGAAIGSPILTFTQDDFQNAGADTPQEFLATLVQTFGGAPSADVSNAYGVAQGFLHGSGLDLRGLGPGTTLVLLNGRRLPLSGPASYVDISMIPISAIERIDIMTDGASALYGSDAVGGVVNIVTRRNYTGAQTLISAGTTTRGGGDEYRAAQSVGTNWGSGEGLLSLEAYEIKPVPNEGRGVWGVPGQELFQLSAGQRRLSAFGSLRQSLMANVDLVADASYSERDVAGVFRRINSVETVESNNTAIANSLGLELDLPHGWSGGASMSRSLTEGTGIYGAPGFLSVNNFSYEVRGLDAKASGALLTLPGGPVRAAFGGGLREDIYSAERYSQIGSFVSRSGSTPEDRFAAAHLFAEFNIPLLGAPHWTAVPRLQLSLAGRYEDFDHFGSSVDPRVGLEFLAAPGLRLRSAYSTSFRAPTIEQAKPPQGNTVYAYGNPAMAEPNRFLDIFTTDSELGPETSTNWSAGFVWEPEWLSGFRLDVNWYDIAYENRIATPPFATLEQMLADPATYDDLLLQRGEISDAEFDALVEYYLSGEAGAVSLEEDGPDACTAPCPGPASGFVFMRFLGLRNLASTHERGFDIRLNQTFDEVAGGRLELGLDTTVITDLSRRIFANSPEVSFLNRYAEPVSLRMRGSAIWTGREWLLATYMNYVGEHSNTRVTPAQAVSALTTFDATARWALDERFSARFMNGVALTLNVTNLLDDLPPLIARGGSGGTFYDATSGDPWGRGVSLTLTKSW